ncbi:MAG: transcriptional regulator [Sphingomonas sp. 28-63-12]|nr:MAG: transcriptional regulator [Sphingomonas sp. 28-63-12]
MAQADEVIHQSTRLKIMAALDSDPDRAPLDFMRLKAVAGATDGNLGAHLSTLENAGYIAIEKLPNGKRFRTLVTMTPTGRDAFRGHIAYLQDILDAVRSPG